jgi:hypothetical protein
MNCRFWFFEKEVQNQRAIAPSDLKNLKELAIFMNGIGHAGN